MYQVIIVIHVLLGLGIIGLILMQQGKGADAGAAFGSGSAGSVFGAQGAASFLSRATAILATLFFITSLGLAMINGNKGAPLDFIGTQQDTLDFPEVGGTKGVDTTPAMPEIKSEEMPAVPEVKPTEQPAGPVSGAKIENIVVPKAEEIKTVKEPNNSVPKASKEAIKNN